MKPRIWKWNGIWHCKEACSRFVPAGTGYTPKEAYDDWLLTELARTSEAAGLEAT